MKKTTTIENVTRAQARILAQFEEVIHTRHIIHCSRCPESDEFNEGDALDAAAWFQACGWKVRGGKVKCPGCARK